MSVELTAARIVPSSDSPGRVRLVGDVVYDDGPGKEQYWFEVAEENAGFLSQSGNPWLVALLPVAAAFGQRLRIRLPVDRLLYRNVREALSIWRAWHPHLRPIEVEAETTTGLPEPGGRRTGATFSAGVDSFFTVVRSTLPGEPMPIDDLVLIGGFDILLRNLAAFERLRARQERAAASLGKSLIDVVTNLRETRMRQVSWGKLAHGCALASVGLALEGRFRRFVIASTWDYPKMGPHGSNPMIDPLFSTSRTQMVHDGATHTRLAKLETLATSKVALENLHVCFRIGSDRNCGSCEKCLRTMAALDLLGSLHAASFASASFDARRLSRAFLPTKRTENYYRDLRSLAAARGRPEIVHAVNRAMRRSAWRRRAIRFPEWLANRRGLWWAAKPVRRAILTGEAV
jgi:hypothetical protein